MKNKQAPELLMPAGSLEKLKYAYIYGADAAYVGLPYYSLRARENDFNFEQLHQARELADSMNKKLYVTVNIFSKNRKIQNFAENMDRLLEVKPDAIIMSDPGLMMMMREQSEDIPIHLSVQANCMNWKTVEFWHKSLNVERVILSRELNLNEIRTIKDRVPTIELEAFVHGSLCIAYSGRCFMSSYFSNRDANQGVCDNSCREKFNVFETSKKVDKDKDYFVEDLRSPGELYQLNEDEEGTYIMNSKDLRLIEHLKEVYEAGVESFKIEGRTKSINYVSLVAKSYRKAIDDMMAGNAFDTSVGETLDKVANRGYHTGFMIPDKNMAEVQNYDTSVARDFTQRYGGLVKEIDEQTPEGYIPIEVRNKIVLGHTCELISPQGQNSEFTVTDILNHKKESVESAHGGAGLYYFKADLKPEAHSLMSVKVSSKEFHAQQ